MACSKLPAALLADGADRFAGEPGVQAVSVEGVPALGPAQHVTRLILAQTDRAARLDARHKARR